MFEPPKIRENNTLCSVILGGGVDPLDPREVVRGCGKFSQGRQSCFAIFPVILPLGNFLVYVFERRGQVGGLSNPVVAVWVVTSLAPCGRDPVSTHWGNTSTAFVFSASIFFCYHTLTTLFEV